MSRRKLPMAHAVLRPRVSERVEQTHIVQLLHTLRAKVYVLGNHRRKGDYYGTMQTPGLQDLQAFLPRKPKGDPVCRLCGHVMNGQGGMCTALDGACRCVCEAEIACELLFVEAKATGGRLRPEQAELRDLCRRAGIAHVVGGLDAVIAWLVAHGYLTADSVPHYRQPGSHA